MDTEFSSEFASFEGIYMLLKIFCAKLFRVENFVSVLTYFNTGPRSFRIKGDNLKHDVSGDDVGLSVWDSFLKSMSKLTVLVIKLFSSALQ